MVLEALGQKAGPEDTRTAAQRRHDAIEEACRRLIGGQMIPGRDGQPPHLTVHIDLNDLRRPAARCWNGPGPRRRAAAGPGSVYLTGPAAEAAACDAVVTPMVTGQIDWAVLDQLTTVWLTAHGHAHTGSPPDDHPDGPPESHPAGPPESQPDGRPEDHPDGPRESQPDGPRDDHAGGPRDDQPDGRPESRDANQPAARTGHPPGSGPARSTATSRSPAPATAPARAPARPPPRTTTTAG